MANEPPSQLPEGAPTSVVGGGAIIRTISGNRAMKVFPIPETELRQLSYMNWLTTLFLSLAASAFTFCLSIVIGVGISSEPLSEKGEFINDYGVWFFASLLGLFLALAVITFLMRGSSISQIEKESEFGSPDRAE